MKVDASRRLCEADSKAKDALGILPYMNATHIHNLFSQPELHVETTQRVHVSSLP